MKMIESKSDTKLILFDNRIQDIPELMAIADNLLDEFDAEPRDEILPDGTHVSTVH